jgi:hypothetical protein
MTYGNIGSSSSPLELAEVALCNFIVHNQLLICGSSSVM